MEEQRRKDSEDDLIRNLNFLEEIAGRLLREVSTPSLFLLLCILFVYVVSDRVLFILCSGEGLRCDAFQ
jgi:hypothetical protein